MSNRHGILITSTKLLVFNEKINMQPETTGVKTWQWVVTVIVIVVLIILGYYMFKGNDVAAPATIDTTTGSDISLPAGKDVNRVVVTDQFPGNIVYLSSVQLTKGGFVAIHKDNKGTPGEVIGVQYFSKGINPGKITLTSPTVEGGVYYAMLHSDDGDMKYVAATDLPLKDASGNVIMKIFRVSSTVTEVKG